MNKEINRTGISNEILYSKPFAQGEEREVEISKFDKIIGKISNQLDDMDRNVEDIFVLTNKISEYGPIKGKCEGDLQVATETGIIREFDCVIYRIEEHNDKLEIIKKHLQNLVG